MGTISIPSVEDLPRTADMVIVGGGVIGVATAFWAGRAGMRVVCLERRDGLGTLTTAASEECFRAQFSEPDNIRMMKASIGFFERFAEETGLDDCDLGLRQQGYLFLSKAEDGLEALGRRVALQRQRGLDDVELLDGAQVRKRFPFVAGQVTAATFRARDGWLSTHALTYNLARATAEGRFCLRTEATGLTSDAQGVAAVETNRGPIATRCAVLASGPYAGVWAARCGVQVPVVAVRRHKAIITGYPEIPADAPMTIDDANGAYWRPETGGGALGWALPEPESTPSDAVPTDWTFPAVVLEAVSELTPFWGEIAERLRRDDVFLSAGQYPETPDANPIIDACAALPGLYLNVGYGGHGIMASPEGGRMLVDLVLGRGEDECRPFRLERFGRSESRRSESMVI
ncbi:MAG TPA: FAD-dependent oxidoreductase [Anaerolineae bacterium]|nr:FAD-dependent oxidoreductase [Anaerolineae bacterium]HOR00973.1 FAD-dependent oxidoreductase [Anaerolineae bacterium]